MKFPGLIIVAFARASAHDGAKDPQAALKMARGIMEETKVIVREMLQESASRRLQGGPSASTLDTLEDKLQNSPVLSSVLGGSGGGFVCPSIDCNKQSSPTDPICDFTCSSVDSCDPQSGTCDSGTTGFTIGIGSCNGANDYETCEDFYGSTSGSIGCASCIGETACAYFGDGATVGSMSCHGYTACDLNPNNQERNVTIGDLSCIGENACNSAYAATIGDFSCINGFGITYSACEDIEFTKVGTGSCLGAKSCADTTSSIIGDGSCIGDEACYDLNNVEIGNGSCIGDDSCNCLNDGDVVADGVLDACPP